MKPFPKIKRLKISDNFYLDEFIHPEIYRIFGNQSKMYLNPELPRIAEIIRAKFNEARKIKNNKAKEVGLYLNTWATGGVLINSGVRDYLNPHKKNSRSRHYLSMCMDLHLSGGGDELELYNHILEYKSYYFNIGITVLEDYNYTPGWVHVSIEWTDQDEIKIIKP